MTQLKTSPPLFIMQLFSKYGSWHHTKLPARSVWSGRTGWVCWVEVGGSLLWHGISFLSGSELIMVIEYQK